MLSTRFWIMEVKFFHNIRFFLCGSALSKQMRGFTEHSYKFYTVGNTMLSKSLLYITTFSLREMNLDNENQRRRHTSTGHLVHILK